MDDNMTELKAKEGYLLTNGEIYSDLVYLSDLDSPDNWKEITVEEARERQESNNTPEMEGEEYE